MTIIKDVTEPKSSMIWDKLIDLQDEIIRIFDDKAEEFEEPGLSQFNKEDGSWINRVWRNDSLRRCHIDVVDARNTKGLWMMHVCCFPNLNNNAPIYGFDVIAGKNKITGAFHDFSPSTDLEHDMIKGYNESVADFIPEKKRELPDWAKAIFSDNMLAAGNVKSEEEADAIIGIALHNLHAYFEEGVFTQSILFIKSVVKSADLVTAIKKFESSESASCLGARTLLKVMDADAADKLPTAPES